MQSLSWQQQLANAIKQPEQLLSYLGLAPDVIGYSEQAISQFPVRVPHVFADRMKHQDPDDPLLRQVFPYIDEELARSGYVPDPLQENDSQPTPGLLHKYQGRVLSITTGACAIHCRYCFRRHFPYQDSQASLQRWKLQLAHIETDASIQEVIRSGGDPLTLSDEKILNICRSLANIDHIQRIRFHTRLPVVLPARLSAELLQQISELGKTIVFVLHINHANEIDDRVVENIELLHQHDMLVLNQSVLLKGVNDSVERLIDLSEKLVANRVQPYYLHLLDPVAGAAHYEVPIGDARRLVEQMRNRVSGYLVPRLVKEEPGLASKTGVETFA